MKFRCVAIALAFLAACASDSWGESKNRPSGNETPKTEQAAKADQRGTPNQPLSVNVVPTDEQKEDTKKKDTEAAVKAADDKRLVEYTGYQVLIGIVTFFIFVLQLIAFSLQAGYMRRTVVEMRHTTHATIRAARASQKAAIAADLSANAIIVVERAYVYPIIVAHGAIEECIKTALVYYEGDPTKDDVPAPVTAEITFKFKNFGKTPAILKTAFVGLGVNTVGAEIGVPVPEAVLGVSEETKPIPCKMYTGISRNQAHHINVCTGHVCFTGQVTFDDIWGDEHTTEFSFTWDKDIKRMTLYYIGTKTDQQPK